MKTISMLPPEIRQQFSETLLDPLLDRLRRVERKLILLADRKIRAQDTEKRKMFDALLEEFMELYERKTVEKAQYQAKIENAKKRSCIPATGGVVRFTRVESER